MVTPPDNSSEAGDQPGQGQAELLFGVAGWSYKDWEGMVYPGRADAATKMLTVAAACDLLEINTSFYRIPEPGMSAAWARRLARAGLNTRIVVKLNRAFSHEPDYTAEQVRAARDSLAPLDDDAVIDRDGVEQPRLLGLLLQFPHFFRLSNETTQRIERLAEDFADWNRFIELRHASWSRTAAWDWLKKLGFSLVNIDLPASSRPPAESGGQREPPGNLFPAEPVVTAGPAYLRLHGRNAKAWFDRRAPVEQKYNYLYEPEELADLADRVRKLADRARSVVVVGNNHYRGKALATVLSLANLLQQRRARLPAPMLEAYPRLRDFADEADPFAPPEPKKPPPRSRPRPDDHQLKLFD